MGHPISMHTSPTNVSAVPRSGITFESCMHAPSRRAQIVVCCGSMAASTCSTPKLVMTANATVPFHCLWTSPNMPRGYGWHHCAYNLGTKLLRATRAQTSYPPHPHRPTVAQPRVSLPPGCINQGPQTLSHVRMRPYSVGAETRARATASLRQRKAVQNILEPERVPRVHCEWGPLRSHIATPLRSSTLKRAWRRRPPSHPVGLSLRRRRARPPSRAICRKPGRERPNTCIVPILLPRAFSLAESSLYAVIPLNASSFYLSL